jgi:hypothetical protein
MPLLSVMIESPPSTNNYRSSKEADHGGLLSRCVMAFERPSQ